MRYYLIFVFSLLSVVEAFCDGGSNVYKFLSLPNSAQVSALGGSNISLKNGDVNMAFQNPSLLDNEMNNAIALNYVNYLSDVNYGSVGYSRNINSYNAWAIGVTYLNYGTLDGYTEDDVATGEFSAGDICITALYSRQLFDRIRAGMALKPIYSYIDSYSSFGLAVDVGACYSDTLHDFTMGLTLKNVGVQLTGYYDDEDSEHRERLPWELQFGLSKRLAHAPFRFSLTFVDLNRWDLDYYRSPKSVGGKDDDISWGDMLLRHTLIGLEFIPTKSFSLMAAYNHRRSQEYDLEDTKSFNGFSFGGFLNVYKFKLGVAYAQYATAGNTLTVSLATSLDEFRK
ncbi:MAG: type IX secretion system protein PorQ [Paludibacteraceae bacterium]|nr:type IX secretion system protein PorQ [Paludibacteraceae bacterium]